MNLNVHEQSISHLDEALVEQMQMMKAIRTVRSMKYKQIGRSRIAISPDERRKLVNIIRENGNKKCSKIYINMNTGRKKAGVPAIKNIFERN